VTERRDSLARAVGARDITLALTPAQLVVLVVAVWLVVKLLRSARG
jgi:hypothetical protein